MAKKTIDYSDVQCLFELCTSEKSLKEFYQEIGVSYSKYLTWQRQQLLASKVGKRQPEEPVMGKVMLTECLAEETADLCAPQSATLRYIHVKLSAGVMFTRTNITAGKAVSLINKLSSVLC